MCVLPFLKAEEYYEEVKNTMGAGARFAAELPMLSQWSLLLSFSLLSCNYFSVVSLFLSERRFVKVKFVKLLNPLLRTQQLVDRARG